MGLSEKNLRFLLPDAEIAGIPSAGVLFFLLVMTIGYSLLVHGLPEEGFFEGALRAGIDGVGLGLLIRHEMGGLALGHVQQFQPVSGFAVYRHRLSRRDVVPGLKAVLPSLIGRVRRQTAGSWKRL